MAKKSKSAISDIIYVGSSHLSLRCIQPVPFLRYQLGCINHGDPLEIARVVPLFIVHSVLIADPGDLSLVHEFGIFLAFDPPPQCHAGRVGSGDLGGAIRLDPFSILGRIRC